MKEKIYTIPVNEAYEISCECPLCELEKKLENETIEYSLGPAMMEPDFRIESNEKGFCRTHFTKMFEASNKLSLALVLDTHLEEVRNKLDAFKKPAQKLLNSKGSLFKKRDSSQLADEISKTLCKIGSNCVVCEKINYTMSRYIDVLLYMWATDDEFKAKFDASKGMCLKHFGAVLKSLDKSLSGKDADAFLSALVQKETTELSRIQDDIHKFTLKFDYRNKDMDWGTAKDAPKKTIEKLSGFIDTD